MNELAIDAQQAIDLQNRLRSKVQLINGFSSLEEIKTIAGIDAAYNRNNLGRVAVVVFNFPDLVLVEQATAKHESTFPYTSGLLSFREMPLALAALEKLKTLPDLIILDGHGYAHPRRFGFACHLGVYLNRPTIGCAKKRLVGQYDEPGPEAGDFSLLTDQGETIGAVLRTASQVKPVFISAGHRIDLATSIEIIMKATRGYRLPEPTRQADILAATVK